MHPSPDIHMESPKQLKKHKFKQNSPKRTTTVPPTKTSLNEPSDFVSPKRSHNFNVTTIAVKREEKASVIPTIEDWIPPSSLNETANFQD